MMSEEPAFPRTYSADGHNGMSLRDYFAGQALAGVIANSESVHAGETPIYTALSGHARRQLARSCADIAYLLADAMLEARAKKPEAGS